MNSLWSKRLTLRYRQGPVIVNQAREVGLDVSVRSEHAEIGRQNLGIAMALENTYRRSVEFWKNAVSNLSDDWSRPTPCPAGMSVRLVNHVVGEDRWTKPLVEGKTIAEVGDAFEGDLLGEDPKTSALAAADEALTAVAVRLPAGGMHLSYGEEDIGEYISQLSADPPDPWLGSFRRYGGSSAPSTRSWWRRWQSGFATARRSCAPLVQ